MARDLTAGMVTALEARVVRPVLIGRLDILSDPIIAWTGPGVFAPSGSGDTALDGQIFVSMAPFIEMSDIIEDQGIGGPVSITISGHDLNAEALRQVVRDRRQWRGRDAYLWMGLMNGDEATAVADPVRIKTGVMTKMTTRRDANNSSVTVTIDRDLGNAKSAAFRWIDHARIWTGDLWSSYILALSNNPGGLGGFDRDSLIDRDRR